MSRRPPVEATPFYPKNPPPRPRPIRPIRGLFALALLLAPTTASAISCTVSSTTSVSFGTYSVLSSTPLDTAGSATIHCTGVTGGDNITVDLDTGGSGTYTARTLLDGAETLAYNLYLDAARTTIWGNGTGSTSRYGPTVPPDDQDVEITAYGRIPAQQDVSAGTYADTVVVTITF